MVFILIDIDEWGISIEGWLSLNVIPAQTKESKKDKLEVL